MAIANATGAQDVQAETTVSVQTEVSIDGDYDLSDPDDLYELRLAIATAYDVPIEYIQLDGGGGSRRSLLSSSGRGGLDLLVRAWKWFGALTRPSKRTSPAFLLPYSTPAGRPGSTRGAGSHPLRSLAEMAPERGQSYILLDVWLPRYVLSVDPEAGRHFVAVEERRAGRGLRLVTFSFSITFPKDEVQDALDVAAGLAEPTLLANELGVDVDTESAPSLAVEMVFVAPIMTQWLRVLRRRGPW